MGRTTAHSIEPGALIWDLDTPTIVVDLDRLERNIRAWQAALDGRGTAFRPHIKTHKVPEIARMQVAAGARGIVCAKVSEAEPFADAGIDDICIAYPVFGEAKWRRVAALAARGVRVTVNCDNEEAARGLSGAAVDAGVTLHLQIDVDTGLGRGGVPAGNPIALERLARTILALPGVELDGITTFRSIGFEGASTPRHAGRVEGHMMTELAETLRGASIEVREVTAGSTPTAQWAAEVPGVTEVRAGTYVFHDLMQLANGTASADDLALSVLCTVVSRTGSGRIVIDGGSKTFSGDAGAVGSGIALAGPVARGADHPVFVERLNEEHGVARAECDVALGGKLRFHPYHVCTCANLADEIVGYRGERVEVVWPVRARGLRH
jgi:D-serine deaminase-like pyridoxal phosphate-dependent protein